MERDCRMSADSRPLLPYAISICGLDELVDLLDHDISHVLSILDPDWPDPALFAGFPADRREVFRFHDVIDEAFGCTAPIRADVQRLLILGERWRDTGVRHLLIHCHAGISRSTAAAAALLAQRHPGQEDDAFRCIAGIRSWSWPNSRMVEFADSLLGRKGRLIAAMRRHHGRMIERWPDLSRPLAIGSRAREYFLAKRQKDGGDVRWKPNEEGGTPPP
jgi:predicted protein tyrosine phosphatase